MWDEYHVFLVTPLVITRRVLDEIYYLTELPFMRFTTLQNSHLIGRCWRWNGNFCLHDELILDFVTTICHGKRLDLNSHWLSSFCNKRTDKPSVLIILVHGDRWHKNEFICLHAACSNGNFHLNLWQLSFSSNLSNAECLSL